MKHGFTTDSRAAVFSTEYALTALVAIGLLAAVPTAFASVADSTQEDVQQAELDRVAGEVAAAIDAVDHQYAQHQSVETNAGISGVTPAAQVRPSLPAKAADTTYVIRIRDGTVIAEPPGPTGSDARGTAPIMSNLTVTANGGTPGGAVVVELDASAGEIVIKADATSGEIPTEAGVDA